MNDKEIFLINKSYISLSYKIISNFIKFLLMYILLLYFEAGYCATWHHFRKWEYIQPRDYEVILHPERKEIISGEVATFTIVVRNKTKDNLELNFKTGQRYDLAVWRNGIQIYRWSQGKIWADTPNSLLIKPHNSEKFVLSWKTIDRNYCPLPHGVYEVVGILMVLPRAIMSNTARIELLPPRLYEGEELNTRLNQVFELELPTVLDLRQVSWAIEYDNNKNHIKIVQESQRGNSKIFSFLAQRPGRVVIRAYAYYIFQDKERSLERRVFYVNILGN